jgi:hypothetical protein
VTRKDGTKGDLLVTVEVTVPKNLSAGAAEAVEALGHRDGADDLRQGLFDAASDGGVMATLPLDDDTPVYVISVAAQLSGLHPADAAAVRPDGSGVTRPYGRRRTSLLRPRHRAAARGASGSPAEGVGLEACAASSSWRTR